MKGRSFSAEGFLNGICVLFPLTIKLGNVFDTVNCWQLKPLLLDLSVEFYWIPSIIFFFGVGRGGGGGFVDTSQNIAIWHYYSKKYYLLEWEEKTQVIHAISNHNWKFQIFGEKSRGGMPYEIVQSDNTFILNHVYLTYMQSLIGNFRLEGREEGEYFFSFPTRVYNSTLPCLSCWRYVWNFIEIRS